MLPFCDTERGTSDTEYAPIKEVKNKIAEQVIDRTENKKHTHCHRCKRRKVTNVRISNVSSIRDLVNEANYKHQSKDKKGEYSRLAPDLEKEIRAVGILFGGVIDDLAHKAVTSDSDTDEKVIEKHFDRCTPSE